MNRLIAGRYRIEAEIGRGGMGTVWRAHDSVLGRTVALKRIGLLPGQSGPDAVRARREATLAARIQHPHVVAVFDLVDEGAEQWLVMEYVEGRSLAGLVADRGSLSPDEAAGVLAQVADALAASHAAGVVHRDVKPSNILVTMEGQAKLTDFGIARGESDVTLTGTGVLTGSPSYIAPEVVTGGHASAASDVWSLGATLVHAVTGRPPYPHGDGEAAVLATLYKIVHEPSPRPAAAGRLAPLLDATMVADPTGRWSAAQARDFLLGRAVPPPPAARATVATARPPGPTTPLPAPALAPDSTVALTLPPAAAPRSASRRQGRRPAWALPALAVIVLVGVIGAAWLVGRGGGGGAGGGGGEDPSAGPARKSTTSDSPDPSPSQPAGPTAEGMRAFIGDYLSTVVRDRADAFAMLTPAFQEESGGIDGYRGFWDQVASTELHDVQADPGSMVVAYDYTYRLKAGGSRTEQVRLRLQYDDGRYLIAGED